MYYFVNKEKYCEIKKCQLQKPFKYFSILRPMKSDVRFEYAPWKNV